MIERLMALSGFKQTHPYMWVRMLPPIEGPPRVDRSLTVTYLATNGQINLSLHPPIGPHTVEDHRTNALGGGIMFKLLMTLGEQLGADVTQDSLVGECRIESGDQRIALASYPEQPLMFENLCLGFRQTLMQGVEQEPPSDTLT